MPRIEEIIHVQSQKIKNLEAIRRDPKATEITYIDQADREFVNSKSRVSFVKDPPVVLTDMKKSRTMSSPKVYMHR